MSNGPKASVAAAGGLFILLWGQTSVAAPIVDCLKNETNYLKWVRFEFNNGSTEFTIRPDESTWIRGDDTHHYCWDFKFFNVQVCPNFSPQAASACPDPAPCTVIQEPAGSQPVCEESLRRPGVRVEVPRKFPYVPPMFPQLWK